MSTECTPGARDVDLSQTSWTELLFALLSGRFTGRLELRQHPGGAVRRVVFHGGFPVVCDWALGGTGLSELLAEQGKIGQADALSIRDGSSDDSLGAHAYVRARGIVDDEAADLALRDQCERRVAAIGSVRAGVAKLRDETGLDESLAASLCAARTLRVIQQVVRKHYHRSRIEEELAHLKGASVVIAPAYRKYEARFDFGADEGRVLASLVEEGPFLLNGVETRFDLEPERVLQLLCTLKSCNMLRSPVAGDEAAGAQPRGVSAVLDMLAARADSSCNPTDFFALDSDASLAMIDAAYEDLHAQLGTEFEESGVRRRAAQMQGQLLEFREEARARRGVTARGVADRALKEQAYKRARDALADLVALDPRDVEAEVDLGWVHWKISRQDAEAQAELARVLDAALEKSDSVARAHFYRGQLHKFRGEGLRAVAAFERAAQLDRAMLDAQREARALRSGATGPVERSTARSRRDELLPAAPSSAPRWKYWTGMWPTLWVFAGSLFVALLAAQVILRLDADF